MLNRVGVVALLLATSLAAAKKFKGFAGSKHVVTVTGETFQQEVVLPTLPVVMMVYSPKSDECAKTAPIYEQAAELLEGHAKFAAFDGSTEQGKGLAQMFGVNSVPAFLMFNPEMMPVEGQQEGAYMKMPIAFNGKRTLANFVRFVYQGSSTKQITRLEDTADWAAFSGQFPTLDLPRVVLVTAANHTSPIFRAASHAFRYGAQFAVVTGATLHSADELAQLQAAAQPKKDGDKPNPQRLAALVAAEERAALLSFLGVTSLPALAMVTGTDDVSTVSATGMNLKQLLAHIEKVALPKQKRLELTQYFLSHEEQARRRERELEKLNSALEPIQITSPGEFEDECVKRTKGVCVIAFLEGLGDVPTEWLLSASKEMAKRSQVQSQIVVVDAWANSDLANFFGAPELGYPTAVFVEPGKKRMHGLIGSFSERGLTSFFLDKMPSSRGKPYDPKKVPAWKPTQPPEEEEGQEAADGDDVKVEDEL